MPPADECLETVEDSLINRLSILEMLYHDAVQQVRGHARVPDAFGINDDDGPGGADAEAWRLAPLDALWSEEKIFALEQLREQRVDLSTAAVRRAEFSRAHKHVTGIRLHLRR